MTVSGKGTPALANERYAARTSQVLDKFRHEQLLEEDVPVVVILPNTISSGIVYDIETTGTVTLESTLSSHEIVKEDPDTARWRSIASPEYISPAVTALRITVTGAEGDLILIGW